MGAPDRKYAGEGWTESDLTNTKPLSQAKLSQIKAGDVVLRLLAGASFVGLRVTDVDDSMIYCGEPGVGWKFRRDTGAEVDEDLGWDGVTLSGSFITAFMRK